MLSDDEVPIGQFCIDQLDQTIPFDTEFEEDSRLMHWPVADIRKFLDKNPELAIKFNDTVNRHLVAQLDMTFETFTNPSG